MFGCDAILIIIIIIVVREREKEMLILESIHGLYI